ncbi:hypothetical protein HZB00_03965 [Candidatus Woesearchaeota archaeon]|nr:hypothetical protein [Candidatus Woesearchaeota archaeon]
MAKKSSDSKDAFLESQTELLHALKECTDAQTKASQQLMDRMDKLLSLFEEAAKQVGEVESVEGRVNALATKLESLLDQNKSIAQGLILLEKYVRGKTRLEPSMETSKPLV